MKNSEKKSIRQFIIAERSLGKTDKEIYENLKTKHSDKKAIAKLIAGTATKESIEKHKWLAHLLSMVLTFGCVFYSYMAWVGHNSAITMTYDFVIRAVIFFVITLAFIYLVYQFKVEESLTFFVAFLWTYIYTHLARTSSSLESIVATTILIIVLILAYVYNRRMYPKWSMSGIKKDKNGEFIV